MFRRHLNKLIESRHHFTTIYPPLNAGIRHTLDVQPDGSNRIIITGNDVVDTLGVTVGVNDTNHRNAQLVGFGYRNALVIDIDHEQCIGQTRHILDTTDGALQLGHIPGPHQGFFLGQFFKGAVRLLRLQLAQPLDRSANGFVVGEHATQPAMADIGHFRTLSLFPDLFAGGAFGAHEQNLVLFGSQFADHLEGFVESGNCMFQIDDMNLVTGAENVRLHSRIPVASLVSEVRTCLQQFAHTDLRHDNYLVWVSPPHAPSPNPAVPRNHRAP